MFLCHRWRTNWWRCAGSSISIFPSWLSKCPRSHLHPFIAGAVCASREQTAEQLVEVSTIISYSSFLRTMEQNVDIPGPGRGGRSSGFQGFLPGQSSTAQLASLERISQRIVEQIVDSRVVGGGFQDFRPVQSSSASADQPGVGFSHFSPNFKKVRNWVRTRVRVCPPVSAHPRRHLSTVFVSCRGS